MDWSLTRNVDNARIRLAALALDTAAPIQREDRRLSAAENLAIMILLDELHRINQVTSNQREMIAAQAAAKNPQPPLRKASAIR